MSASHPPREEVLRFLLEEHAEPDAVRAHLSACAECRDAAGRLERITAAIRGRAAALLKAPPPPPAISPRARPRILRFALPIAAAASILAVVLPRLLAAPVVARTEALATSAGGAEIRRGARIEAQASGLRIRFEEGTAATARAGAILSEFRRDGVRLESGWLHVAAKPGFVVRTKAGRIVDLGTVFVVRTKEVKGDGMFVTVVHGKVRIEPDGGAPVEVSEGREWPDIGRGTVDVAAETEWVRGLLFPPFLEDVPLGRLFDLVEETSPWRIEAPESLRRIRVTAALDKTSPEGVFQAASTFSGVPHSVEGRVVKFQATP